MFFRLLKFLLPVFFLFLSCDKIEFSWDLPRKPVVEVLSRTSNVFGTECTIRIIDDGGSPVIDCGICYGLHNNPTLNDSTVRSNPSAGTISVKVSGLNPGTAYSLKAFASNRLGTGYSDLDQFTTSTFSITTSLISAITQTTAKCGGYVPYVNDISIITKGVCWNTSPHPTIAHSKTVDGSGTGSFISNMTGLSPATTYYVRAYVTANEGIAYGDERIFITGALVLPTIYTTAITSFTSSSAQTGGNITSDGGSPVVARGACWNTTGNPTILNPKTSDGYGTGTYVSNLTGLTENTFYYVRSFATNSIGTAYGNQQSFRTRSSGSSTLPTDGLIAYYPFNGNANDESGNGNIGEIGGATLTTDRKGINNSAYSFNGTNNFIKARNLVTSNNFSVNVWISTSSSVSRQEFISGGGYYNTNAAFTGHTQNCIPSFDYTNIPGSPGHTSVCGNNWVFITFNVSNGYSRLYVNGVEEASFNSSCNINGTELNIGRAMMNGRYYYYFNGKIDDIRLYNRALTTDEIRQLLQE